MLGVSRKLRLVLLTLVVAGALTACVPAPTPAVTLVQTSTATVTATPTATPSPTPTPDPIPEAAPPPPPPAPPVPPNAMGGQTDGGNTATTPLVSDGGPQQFAVGTATAINDYEYSYTVAAGDQVLAIASRFNLQTDDVVRVNFRCSDPLEVQPGDVLDIRWPIDSEAVGSGCVKSVTG
jgi:LysM repeat protein